MLTLSWNHDIFNTWVGHTYFFTINLKYKIKYKYKKGVKMKDISYKIKDLEGKTIERIDVINAEFGRTYDRYLGFTCSDGTRVLLHGGQPYDPKPKLEDMRKTNFFTPKEIANKLEQIEIENRKKQQDSINAKRRELERLKRELGEE